MPIVKTAPNAAVLRIFDGIADAVRDEDGNDVMSALATATLRGFIQLRQKVDGPEVRAWMHAVGKKFVLLSECSAEELVRLSNEFSDTVTKQ